MDSMILCKFLRGVFEDPFTEWARLLTLVTGWDLEADELHESARRIVMAKRAFNLREGATAADDTLPVRMLQTPLELASGRTVSLTAERLHSMVADYYAARGLDREGRVLPADLAELFLDV
jgi:aldehyde:ferredoxin oxidoreductase